MDPVPEPRVTYAPLFHPEHQDRFLLFKFTTWPDTEETVVHRLKANGSWTPVDEHETYVIDTEDLPLIAPECEEVWSE
jgi:hypothetical protein